MENAAFSFKPFQTRPSKSPLRSILRATVRVILSRRGRTSRLNSSWRAFDNYAADRIHLGVDLNHATANRLYTFRNNQTNIPEQANVFFSHFSAFLITHTLEQTSIDARRKTHRSLTILANLYYASVQFSPLNLREYSSVKCAVFFF